MRECAKKYCFALTVPKHVIQNHTRVHHKGDALFFCKIVTRRVKNRGRIKKKKINKNEIKKNIIYHVDFFADGRAVLLFKVIRRFLSSQTTATTSRTMRLVILHDR